mmetsp:Transcript_24669/g.62132  ORF Transcript_24669/g.62132 Transcript_24669/m.62132 type:complete len:830 (-) Transcript_24669:198-2687(-)
MQEEANSTQRTPREVLFNPDNYEPYRTTREQFFGIGELLQGSFSVEEYNGSRIAIVRDTLPDGTPRVAIFDNGVAHEDSLPACYDNALSLICEKKPACRIPNQNGNGGAGYSRNGVGAGTALKHLAPNVVHVIGSHLLVRHGIEAEKPADGESNLPKAKIVLAPFDLADYLSSEWRERNLPMRKFKDRQSRSSTHKRHGTAEAFNLLNFIPMEETADPQDPPAERREVMAHLRSAGKVVPLDCQPEANFRELVSRFQALKGSNTGFCTILLNPHGRWPAAETDAAPDVHFSMDSDVVSMRRMFETCFFQPAWNADDLLERAKAAGNAAGMHDMLTDMLSVPNDGRPGHNVTVEINGGSPCVVGSTLEKLLKVCQRQGRVQFVHQSNASDCFVLGVKPSSVPQLACVMPPRLICDQHPAATEVPEELRAGKTPVGTENKGLLVFHMAHNKVFRVTYHRCDSWFLKNQTVLDNLKRSVADFLKSKIDPQNNDTRWPKSGFPRPIALRGDPPLSDGDTELLALLQKPEYRDIAKEMIFHEDDSPLCVFMFARHTLLDGSKTNYKDFTADVENRILPECLLRRLLARLKKKQREVLERQQAAAEKAESAAIHAQQQAAHGTQISPGKTVLRDRVPRRARTASHLSRRTAMVSGVAGPSTPPVASHSPAGGSHTADKKNLKRKQSSPGTNADGPAVDAARLVGVRKGPSAERWASMDIPAFIVECHKAFSSAGKQLLGAKKSPRSLVGRWVAVKFDHSHEGLGSVNWIGMVLKAVTKRNETGWYAVFFTGIGWHRNNQPLVDQHVAKYDAAVQDTVEEPFIILQADPLRPKPGQ